MDGHHFVSYTRTDADDFSVTFAGQLRAVDTFYECGWTSGNSSQHTGIGQSDRPGKSGPLGVPAHDDPGPSPGRPGRKNEWALGDETQETRDSAPAAFYCGPPCLLFSPQYIDFSDDIAARAHVAAELLRKRDAPRGVGCGTGSSSQFEFAAADRRAEPEAARPPRAPA